MSSAELKARPLPPGQVGADYYAWLTKLSADWEDGGSGRPRLVEPAISDTILREARLLDQQRYEAWLELYAEHCSYWIPASRPALPPQAAVSLEFHDRRRLLDRVARLRTGFAYSQIPPSRTARVVGTPEVWAGDGADEARVRASFMLAEFREDRIRTLAGWYGYALRRGEQGWRIEAKQINLIDCDQPQGNNSFFL